MVSVNQVENKEKKAALSRAYYLRNKETVDTRRRERVAANRETVRARKKAYYVANCEQARAKNRIYKKANAHKVNASRRELYRKQLKSSDNRIRSLLRARLNSALKRKAKNGSAVRDLGCAIQEFKTYIESQFEPGMSWNNRGVDTWHLDHILPLSLFDLTNPEQVKLACHYSNLRPLWAKANLAKRDIVPGWNCPLPSEFFE